MTKRHHSNPTPDTTPPTVSLASPGTTVSGTIKLVATASDANGISKVEFYLDSAITPFGVDPVSPSPYIVTLDTKTIADGLHKITAKAYDRATPSNTSTSSITVTVANTTVSTQPQYTNANPFGFTPTYVEGSASSYFDISNVLHVNFPKGLIGPDGSGYNFQSKLSARTTMAVTYDVMFAPDFDFVKEGKLPGIAGGSATSGGVTPTGTNGFTSRVIWRPNGVGAMYVYHVGQSDIYGDIYPFKDSNGNILSFQKNVWQAIKVVTSVNTLGKADGSVQVYLNNVLVFQKNDFIFRTIDTIQANILCFNTFFGGGDSSFAPPKDETLYIRNVKVE